MAELTSPLALSERPEYLQRQRQLGRKVVGLLPGDVPPEVFTALDLLPLELWGPPVTRLVEARRRLPSTTCSVVLHCLQYLSSGGAAELDALVVPATCDSLRCLGSILGELSPLPCPVFFHEPGRTCSPREAPAGSQAARASAEFRRAELELLIQHCEKLAGRRLEASRLTQALRLHDEADRLSRELQRRRAALVLGERAFMELLRTREYLHVGDRLLLLRHTLARLEQQGAPPPRRTPILLSGIVPEPMDLLDFLEEAELTVAADDLFCLGRRRTPPLPTPGEGPGTPRDQLVRRQEALPPAPTRQPAGRGSRRSAWLLSEVHRAGARGVIVWLVKHCEPELFDLPELREALCSARLPLLVLEHELGTPLEGALGTRLEAFHEMLDAAERARPGTGGR